MTRTELLATLQEVKALIAAPFDGHSNFSSDKLKAIDALCDQALATTKDPQPATRLKIYKTERR